MVTKRILCPQRLRRVPRQFSWIDQRLVRQEHIRRCSPEALALYLLLVTVADAEGLSYYADTTAGRLLNLPVERVARARKELCGNGLIAYQCPLYQVLSLEDPPAAFQAVSSEPTPRSGSGEPVCIGDLLRQAMGAEQ
jgi:hypothetical protein